MHMKKPWAITSDKFLTKEQVSRLIAHLTEQRDLSIARGHQNLQPIRDYYLIRSILETGVRVHECALLVNRDFAGQKLTIRRGKGGKPRTILLTKGTSYMLKEWLSLKEKFSLSTDTESPLFPSRYGQKYTTRGIQKRVESIFGTLGFPENLSTHSLRHTNCSLLLESKRVGLPTVRDNLGHSSLSITNLYAHSVGNLDDVELFLPSSSQNCEKDELEKPKRKLTSRSVVGNFLRNANLNRRDGR